MSCTVIFFWLLVASALSLVLALLGLETLNQNPIYQTANDRRIVSIHSRTDDMEEER